MPTAEQTAARIRSLLEQANGQLPPQAEPLVREYAEKVEQVNQRLAECIDLLRHGLRCEALHAADQDPPLLEEAAALDLPEYELWAELLTRHEFEPPPRIEVQAVEELNEAYNQQAELEPLLRAHRKLALARAPLPHRLQTLRRLAHHDTTNSIWQRDTAELEQARFEQMEKQAEIALAREDYDALHELKQELEQTPWQEDPTASVARRIEAAYSKVRQKRLRQQFSELESELIRAWHADELDTAQTVWTQWQKVAGELGASVHDASNPGFREAAAWVEGGIEQAELQREFDASCRGLEQALDEDRPLEHLQRRWTALERMELPIPRALAARYHARVQERKLEAARKFRLRMAACFGLLLLIGGVVGWVLVQQQQERRYRQLVSQVEQQVVANNWQEADGLLDGIERERPEAYARAEMQAMRQQVTEALEQIEQQQQRFAETMAAIESDPATATQDQLDRARRLAMSSEDRAHVQEMQNVVRRARREAQRHRDAPAEARLDEIRESFEQLRERIEEAEPPDNEAIRALADLDRAARQVATDGNISDSLRNEARTLTEAIEPVHAAAQQRYEHHEQRSRALSRIQRPRNMQEPEQLAAALEQFIESFPGDSFTEDFRAAKVTARQWARVAEAIRPLQTNPLVPVRDHQQATEQLQLVQQIAAKDVGPYAEALEELRAYMERAERALDPRRRADMPRSPLDRLLSADMIAGLYIVDTVDGRRYYLRDRGGVRDLLSPRGWELRAVLSEAQVVGLQEVPRTELAPDAFDGPPDPQPAPQRGFAAEARDHVEDHYEAWETLYLDLLAMLMEHEEIDVLLRAAIAQRLLDWHSDFGWPPLDQFEPGRQLDDWQRRLEGIDTEAPWMDPADDVADNERSSAERRFARMPELEPLQEAQQEWKHQIKLDMVERRPVGMLWEGDEGIEMLTTREAQRLSDGRLEVFTEGDTAEWSFMRIGHVDGGQMQVDTAAAELPAATLVLYAPHLEGSND